MRKPNRSTPRMMKRASDLRKEQTPAEAKLWAYLRARRTGGINFRCQHAIGPYITDFCAPGMKLIIEVDGSPHLDHQEYDSERTAILEAQGYSILRFSNGDVMNKIDGVLAVILEKTGINVID
jgi:very-short-patch-repair endonuclease